MHSTMHHYDGSLIVLIFCTYIKIDFTSRRSYSVKEKCELVQAIDVFRASHKFSCQRMSIVTHQEWHYMGSHTPSWASQNLDKGPKSDFVGSCYSLWWLGISDSNHSLSSRRIVNHYCFHDIAWDHVGPAMEAYPQMFSLWVLVSVG
jgi:hypothetical protein